MDALIPGDCLQHPPRLFADPNYPQHFRGPGLPQLTALAAAIRQDGIRTVLVDLAPWDLYQFVAGTVEQAGARLYNAYEDTDNALRDVLADRFGMPVDLSSCRLNPAPSDGSDFVAYFPQLAASIMAAAFESPFPEMVPTPASVMATVQHLGNKQPYLGGRVPFMQHSLLLTIARWAEGQRARDRATRVAAGEPQYRLGPAGPILLLEEGTGYQRKPRAAAGLEWASQRLLEDLRFQRKAADSLITFTWCSEPFTVFADPRIDGRLEFYVYRKDEMNPAGRPGGWRSRPDFRMGDTIRTQIPKTFQATFSRFLEGRTARNRYRQQQSRFSTGQLGGNRRYRHVRRPASRMLRTLEEILCQP